MDKVFVIAEAGVNHNGSLALAKELVEVAAEAGADAVKFQTFKAKNLVTPSAPKADYQVRATGSGQSQYEMLKSLELSEQNHHALVEHCRSRGIEFLSTPFDIESASFLMNELGLKRIKVPSGEVVNGPFLLALARYQLPLILSTGMSTLQEVKDALSVLAFGYLRSEGNPTAQDLASAFASEEGQRALRKFVSVLHCTTEYPAAYADVNLRAMDTLAEEFGLTIGLSDHTPGISTAVAAVARGARVIEKHFTTNRDLPGPDHKASLEPAELIALIKSIREVEQAIGSPEKAPTRAEIKNMAVARKSLVALKPIKKGELFCESNLGIKRPGTGRSPMQFWDLLGKPAAKDYAAEELV